MALLVLMCGGMFCGSLAFAALLWGSSRSMPLWLISAGALGASVTFLLSQGGQAFLHSIDGGTFKIGGALGFFLGAFLGLWLAPLAMLLGAVRIVSERKLSVETVLAAIVVCAVAATLSGWVLIARLGANMSHPPSMWTLFLCCLFIASSGLCGVVPLVRTAMHAED